MNLIESEETISAGDQVTDYAEPGKGRRIAQRDMAALRGIGASEQIHPPSFQSLQLRVSEPVDCIIDTIKVNLYSLIQGGVG